MVASQRNPLGELSRTYLKAEESDVFAAAQQPPRGVPDWPAPAPSPSPAPLRPPHHHHLVRADRPSASVAPNLPTPIPRNRNGAVTLAGGAPPRGSTRLRELVC